MRSRTGTIPWIAAFGALAIAAIASERASAANSTPPRYGQPVLTASTDYTDFGGIATEDTADFNGDGFVDVLVTRHKAPGEVTYPLLILLNNRRGGFSDGTASIFDGAVPRVQWPRKVVIADFNDDGRPDVFVADTGLDADPGPGFHNTLVLSTPNWKLRDATGNLPPRIRFTHSATAADVNRDGSLDLYIGSTYTWARQEPPELFLNDGTGTFVPCNDCLPSIVRDPVYVNEQWLNGYTYTASHFVDLNNDQSPELVLGGNGFYRPGNGIVSSDSQVLLNDGTGHFSVLPGALPPRPWSNTAIGLDVRSADLNRDGFADLAISYTAQEPYYIGRWVQILINNGNGTFRDETASRLPQTENGFKWATLLRLVELSGDNAPDLIVKLYEGAKDSTPFYVNEGNGVFQALPAGYGNTMNNDFTLVDVRGDGHRDFFTSDDYAFPRILHYVVRQTGRPRIPGAPEGVRVMQARGSRRLVLSWSYVWGAARYEVWRSTSARKLGRKVATTRLMRFVDRTTKRGQTYHYAIRGVNASGKGRHSFRVVKQVR